VPFATICVNFDNYRQLPTAQHRWLLICLARYADREGRCWPSMRQLAADARMSKSSVQRYLADLSRLEVFSRSRRPGGRYIYQLVTVYCRFPDRRSAAVPAPRRAVPQRETQQAPLTKHKGFSLDFPEAPWQQRLDSWRSSRFWLPNWGNRPDEPGCLIPAHLLT
jgi:hypothetical protein